MTYENKRRLVLAMSLLTLPLAWPARAAYRWFGSTFFFDFGAMVLCLVPGTIGVYLRTSFYTRTLTRCGYDLSCGFLSIVQHPDVEIGRGVYLGSLCLVGRKAVIEDDVIIASRVVIKPELMAETADSERTLRIGSGAWVGESAIVMADVGAHCIVGAGCVQDRAVAGSFIAVGNPMRVLAKA